MKFEAVTTCSLTGWDQYGKRSWEEHQKLWPADVPLVVYSEDQLPIPTRSFPAWYVNFRARNVGNPAACGMIGNRYDMQKDCMKYSYKVGAVTAAAAVSEADVLIWKDADVRTHSMVDQEWLESLIDPEAYIGWLDRDRLYPELGFYTLDLNHEAHDEIMKTWIELHDSGRVFAMMPSHDCGSLQVVIERAEKAGLVRVHSISGKARATFHPFVNCRLAERLDHLKGPRKKTGRSHRSDLVNGHRPEAYWKAP